METHHDETVHSQAIVELTEANLTPTESSAEWAHELQQLCPERPPAPSPSAAPLMQELADVLAMEG